MKATFADTHYFVAVLNPRDADHGQAIEVGAKLTGRLVTTEYVLIEVADAFSRPNDRPRFLKLLDLLANDPQHDIVPASESVPKTGIDLWRARPDKYWSLTDCLSFAVMKDRGIEDALTADEHFRQAGFTVLL